MVAAARVSSDEVDEPSDLGVTSMRVDLTSDSGPTRMVEAAIELGAVDILVNNVGAVTPRTGGFLIITDGQWHTPSPSTC